MHEEAQLRDLCRKVNEVLAGAGGARVRTVEVWIGALSHVTEAHLRTGWPRVSEGTPAHAAHLEVETSSDLDDPRAQGLLLRRVSVEDP